MKRRIVFATGNENKMKEIRIILADLGMEILSMKEAGVESCGQKKGYINAAYKILFRRRVQMRRKGKSLAGNTDTHPGIRYMQCVLIRLICSWSEH